MTAKEIKLKLVGYLLYDRAYPAVTEGTFLGIADVLAIKDQRYVMEYEIKVTKPDLDSELDTIDFVYKGLKRNDKILKKMSKHRVLHDAFMGDQQTIIPYRSDEPMSSFYNAHLSNRFDPRTKSPNYFSFAVPDRLAEYATRRLQGTPYGVISVGDVIASVKKNQLIHEGDVLKDSIYRILLKGSEAHYRILLQKNDKSI